MRYCLEISYDGTHFAGSQRQKNARTVQGELEQAAQTLFGVPTRVTLSGRTDAGVHAAAQVGQTDGETPVPPQKLAEVLNRFLPADVKVLRSAPAPAGFDCTRAVREKTYCYRFYTSRTPHPLLARYAARLEGAPDLQLMRAAARLLEGEHDFAAFRATGSSARTTVRTIYAITADAVSVCGTPVYELRVTGNGFLYNMVRILAGELYAVGCGIADASDIGAALETGRRDMLFRTLPAEGLMLERVDYGIPLFGE